MNVLRASVRAVLVVAIAALATISLSAQQTESRIIGRMVDDSKGALPGVTVTVTATQTGAVRTAVTEADGSFAVTNLSPGAYTVQAELSGFRPQTRQVVLGLGAIE